MELEGSRDAEGLLTIFPVEIWEKILDKIPSTSKPALLNSYDYFRSMLSNERVYFLFPLVWKVLAARNSLLWKQKGKKIIKNENISPKTLRLVCKAWRSGIDDFYGNTHYSHKLNTIHARENKYKRSVVGYDDDDDMTWGLEYSERFTQLYSGVNLVQNSNIFVQNRSKKSLDDFELAFQDSKSNPFTIRHVTIGVHERTKYEGHGSFHVYSNKLVKLLQKFGHHVYYCDVDVVCNLDPDIVLQHLFKWMECMGNLKYIRFFYCFVPGWFPWVIEQTCQAMRNVFAVRLQFLECIDLGDMPVKIANLFLENNKHVGVLRFVNSCNVICLQSMGLRALTHVHLVLMDMGDLEGLECMSGCWRIETLSIFVGANLDNPMVLYRVLQVLEKWRDSLKNVYLNIQETHGCRNLPQAIVKTCDLPKLKVLKLFGHSKVLLQVFENCRVLEVLIVDYMGLESSPFGVFGYVGQETSPYESRLWKVFPRLKRVVYNVTSYFRRFVT